MEILTRDYGTIEIDEALVVRFENGIIGFEGYRDYVLLNCSDGEPSPFRCMQSTEESSLAFMLFDPFAVRPDYEVAIDEDTAAALSVDSSEDIIILAIIVVPDDFKLMSLNLKAPIIINAKNNRGIQYIVDSSEYGVRHLLTDEVERAKRDKAYSSQTAV